MSTSLAVPASAEAPPYRWVILVVCTLLVASTAAVWHSFSVFLVVLTQQQGWTRGEVALGFFLFVTFSGLTGPNAGQLIDRFGASRVVFGGAIVMAIGLVITSQMTQLWQFYVGFGLISAVGFAAGGWVPVVTVIQTWFRRKVGAAMGIVSAGAGLGIMALVPGTSAAIERIGWSNTYLVMAGVAVFVVAPMAFLLRTGPLLRTAGPRAGAPPIDDPLVVDRKWVAQSWTLNKALRTRRYWFFLAGAFLTSFASQQVMSHQVAYLRDNGFPIIIGASIAGLVGIASVPAKITWGVLSDRIGREATYTIGIALVICALLTLWSVSLFPTEWLPYVYAVLIGAGYAVSATMPPVMTSDMFRGAAYGAIFGGVSMASNIGSGVGSWLAGTIYDVTGSYYLAFTLAIVGILVGAVCVWLAGPRQVRRVAGRVPRTATIVPPPITTPESTWPSAAAPVAVAPAPDGAAWAAGRLAAEAAIARLAAEAAAPTDPAELAEFFEITAARARDRAFRIRRAFGGAQPAGLKADRIDSPGGEPAARLAAIGRCLAAVDRPAGSGLSPEQAELVDRIEAGRAEARAWLAELLARTVAGSAIVRRMPESPAAQRLDDGRLVLRRLAEKATAATPAVLWVWQQPNAAMTWETGVPLIVTVESGSALVGNDAAAPVAIEAGRSIEAPPGRFRLEVVGPLPLTYLIVGSVEPRPIVDTAPAGGDGDETAGGGPVTRPPEFARV